jgi:hypothetical protein
MSFIPDVELTRMKRKIFNPFKEDFRTDGSFTFAWFHLYFKNILVHYIPLLFCSYGVDSQSGRGRFVIEPPEVGAALAGMTITSGAAEARRESSTTGGERDDDRKSDAGRETESSGEGQKHLRLRSPLAKQKQGQQYWGVQVVERVV